LEKERVRVAADLHDQLGPVLSAAKFKLSSIENLLPDEERKLKDSILYIDNILEQIREISNNLTPNTLKREGLVAAIKEFADQLTANSQLKVFIEQNYLFEFPQRQEIHVFRIVQEIIHNTAKHANATKLIIKIVLEKNKMILASVDNGKGFDYHPIYKKNIGLGLNNIRSRVDILGGEFNISSKIGTGTSYMIVIPMENK
jgi:signal transduction histidine kinase